MSIPTIVNVYPAADTGGPGVVPAPPVVRRRSTTEQALAIQLLGNAVDHLLRSRMFLIDEPPTQADADAVHILTLLRRAVFSECEQITESNRSLRQWMTRIVSRGAN